MALAHYGDTALVINPVTGDLEPAASATITVYQLGTTNAISLFNADGTALSNPFTADPQNGRYDFYTTAGQRVTVQVAAAGFVARSFTAEVEPDPSTTGTFGSHTHPETDITSTTSPTTGLPGDLGLKAPLDKPAFTSYVDVQDQGSNPANPASGFHRLFSKSTGLFVDDPLGSVIGPLGSGGGGSSTLAGLTDTLITSPADGDDLSYFGTPGKWENIKRYSRTFESFGGAVGGSVTVQANAWTAARAWIVANGGGEIVFGAGVYTNMPQLDLPKFTHLRGLGYGATSIQAKPSLNTDFLVTHVSTGASDPNGKYLSVRAMKIDGNKANQTAGRGIVSFPAAYVAGQDPSADSQNYFRDLWIYLCKSDGIASQADSANVIDHCRVDANDGNGITTGFDTSIINCNVGGSGFAGINWGGTAGPGSFTGGDINVVSVGTWSYLSGQVTASNGHGWMINGNRNNGAHLSSCGAQDNKAIGFELVGNSFVTMASCVADTNSTSSAGAYPGLDMWGANDNIIELICQDRNGVNTQTHAIQIQNTSTGNTIDVRHRGVSGSTVSTAIQAFASNSVGNSVNVNYYGWGGQGQQYPVFAASFTPDPTAGGTIILGTLTAAITINAVAGGNQWPGQRIRFHLTQDATGGRVITWNGVYHLAGGTALPTTASKRNIIEFEYDATAGFYVETFRSTGI